MRRITKTFRLSYILWIILYYGLDQFIFKGNHAPSRWLAFLSPHKRRQILALPRGKRLVCALEKLGPIFVKCGQLLSVRQDILPLDVGSELIKLQDRVTPFPSKVAINIIETTYQQPIASLFRHFNPTPIASASVAQVHEAELNEGDKVVLKILRPDIRENINCDITLLARTAKWIERLSRRSRHFQPMQLVAEFKQTLFHEIDLVREAANYSQLKHNFDDSPLLYVPKVYWSFAKHNIIVIEQIHGIRIDRVHELQKAGVDLRALAAQGVEIFFTQVFRDCFFHADMHPGNIFVDATNSDHPRYVAVDFGIMGTLDNDDRHYLAENFLAFFNRDYRRIAELHIQSGWVPSTVSVSQLESAIRTVGEPVFGQPLSEISFSTILLRLLQIAEEFKMSVHPQLLLLQKTMYNVEALGRDIYPQLDLWTTAKPILERWITEEYGLKHALQQSYVHIPSALGKLVELPELMYQSLKQYQALQARIAEFNKTYYLKKLHYAYSKIVGILLLLVASVLLYMSKQDRLVEFFSKQERLEELLFIVAFTIGLVMIIMPSDSTSPPARDDPL